ncbi:LamG-like jellyroll fold domain-containing protein [Isosphaeraceae bacterium EP7]
MSSLFPELDVEVCNLTLLPKAGGAGVDYYFALDYWPAGTIYPGSPACYPLLVSSPVVKRGIDVYFRTDYDVSIEIYADSHLSEYGKTFFDLLQTHEIHNAYCEVRYYAKPVSDGTLTGSDPAALRRSIPLWGGVHAALPTPDGSISSGDRAHLAFTYRGPFDSGSVSASLTTHVDADNIRQTLRVIDTQYDGGAGVLTLRCGDVLFKDKEVSRRLDSTILANLDEKWKGKYGAIVFGQSTTAGEGIAIDAPFFDSGIVSSLPSAKLFSGWAFANHPNKSLERILVKNQYTDLNPAAWVEVALESTGSAAGFGEFISYPDVDPPNWARDLSRWSRAVVYAPASDASKILVNIRAYLLANELARCADLIDGQHFFNADNPGFLSQNNHDMTVEFWVNFDTLYAVADRIIMRQGDIASKTLEWVVYLNSANKITFGISSSGEEISRSVSWGTAATTGVWYHVICQNDNDDPAPDPDVGNMAIYVNAGAAVTQLTATTRTVSGSGLSRNAKDITTLTTTVAHGFKKGAALTVTGASSSDFDGDNFEILEVPTTTTIKYEDNGSSGSSGNGTVVATDRYMNRDGPFSIGSNIYGDPGLDGKIMCVRVWSRLLTSVDITNLYNSGTPVLHEEMADEFREGLRGSFDLTEPTGLRDSSSGSGKLTSAANSASISPFIGYGYSTKAVTLTNVHGQARVEVYEAESADGGATYNPVGSALRTSLLDVMSTNILSFPQLNYWQLQPPLVMAPGVPYMTILDFTKDTGNTYFARCSYVSSAGKHHYARDKRTSTSREEAPNWVIQNDTAFDLEHFYLAQGSANWVASAGSAELYSFQSLETLTINLGSGQTHLEFDEGLEFKLCVSGIADDGSGTYTGTPNAIIERPTHLITFTLLDPDFGVGDDVSAADVDLSAFANAGTVLETQYPGGLKMQIVLENQVYAKDFIREICRQARLVFFKTRHGKLSVKAPTMHTSFNARFSEARHREGFDLLSVADRDYAQVVNEFHQLYFRDPVNQPPETDFHQLNPKEKLSNELYITPDESASGDGYFQSLCAASQALYGRREHTPVFNFYDSATWAQPVQNYYCSRYSTLQKRATFRVPRRDFFASLDLFSAVQIQHTGLAHVDGTSLKARAHQAGAPIVAYHEGTPVLMWMGGTLEGQVMEIEESGAWMTLTIETISPFT